MRFVILHGDSMLPTIGKLSIKIVRKADSYSVGDIVSFLGRDGNRYCHRIISINSNEFTTKGDNRKESEKYEIDVPIHHIEGKI